jgi:hypothetical protein
MTLEKDCYLILDEMLAITGGGITVESRIRNFELEGEIDRSAFILEKSAEAIFIQFLLSNNCIPAQNRG